MAPNNSFLKLFLYNRIHFKKRFVPKDPKHRVVKELHNTIVASPLYPTWGNKKTKQSQF